MNLIIFSKISPKFVVNYPVHVLEKDKQARMPKGVGS